MKKISIISIALLLGLVISPVSYGSNNLVQMDLKRTSQDSVDVTLFTTNTYGDNVLVRKKSDNKYVILIPKVQSSGFKASNLNGVKDVVSNVDVKTVNDTNGGYTKVTLITTKPLDIKTRALKSAPITEEQKEYQTLISQANAIKNNISTPPKLREPITEVTVNKAPQKPVENKVKEVEQKEIVKPKEIKLTEVQPEKIQRQTRKEHLAELINEVKNETPSIPQTVPNVDSANLTNEPLQNIQDLPKTPQVTMLSVIKTKVTGLKNKSPHKLPKTTGIIVVSLLCLSFISKLFKAKRPETSITEENIIKPVRQNDYTDITENSELSWKEKYQLYLDSSAEPVSRGVNKGEYKFIKSPAVVNLDKKRKALEQLVSEVSNDEIINNDIEPEIIEIQSEDESISKTIKLKAFEKQARSLDMTKRIKSRFKKYDVEIPLHEQKNIELDESPLYSNSRNFAGANLDAALVDKKRIKYEPKEYIMSSIDEYLSILDREQNRSVSNPITPPKKDYMKGLIVKSGYNIDDKKGFYLINKDGQNALVGKVNDEVFVLKKFDGNISNPIQVRHDNENVYMVKAGGFKSLVEVNEDKMGVLIEL